MPSTDHRSLCIAEAYPWPAVDGYKLRLANMIGGLLLRGPVDFLCLDGSGRHRDPAPDGVTVIERAGPSATLAARVEGPDGLDLESVVVQVFGPGIEEGMEQRGGVDATGLTEVRVPSDGRYRVVVRGTAAGVEVVGEAEGVTGAASPLRVVLVPVR